MEKATIQELDTLRKIYQSARQRVLDEIVTMNASNVGEYRLQILTALQDQIELMEEATALFAVRAIPREYEKGLNAVHEYLTAHKLPAVRPSNFTKINHEAIFALAKDLQHNIDSAFIQIGRKIIRYTDKARDDALRTAGLQASAEKIAGGRTIIDMRKRLIDTLKEQGFMTVQYGSGKQAYQVSLDAYTLMVARSTTAEASNIARENQLKENGYDLVMMSEHYPTCDICAMYQNRIYSISGKDKRFPALFETAFSNGYRNIHPNCRHTIMPYIEELYSAHEVAEESRVSRMPFEDTRPEAERDLYARSQKLNKERRDDLSAYELYKSQLKPHEIPQSFRHFRAERRNVAGATP